MSEDTTRWKAPASDELLWMEDGAQAVVFDRRSRQTHLLNPSAAAALRILIGGPLEAGELRRRMAVSFRPEAGEPGADLTADILTTFDALGLIEPVRP